jgi:hypothetical protein
MRAKYLVKGLGLGANKEEAELRDASKFHFIRFSLSHCWLSLRLST